MSVRIVLLNAREPRSVHEHRAVLREMAAASPDGLGHTKSANRRDEARGKRNEGMVLCVLQWQQIFIVIDVSNHIGSIRAEDALGAEVVRRRIEAHDEVPREQILS